MLQVRRLLQAHLARRTVSSMTSRQRAASTPRPHAAQTSASSSLTCTASVRWPGEMLQDKWRQAAPRAGGRRGAGKPGPHLVRRSAPLGIVLPPQPHD